MKEQMKKAFEYIDAHRDEILALWEELVNIESGTSDKEGVDTVANRVKEILDDEGFNIRIVEYEKTGNAL